jgi:hypothetical protein
LFEGTFPSSSSPHSNHAVLPTHGRSQTTNDRRWVGLALQPIVLGVLARCPFHAQSVVRQVWSPLRSRALEGTLGRCSTARGPDHPHGETMPQNEAAIHCFIHAAYSSLPQRIAAIESHRYDDGWCEYLRHGEKITRSGRSRSVVGRHSC